MAGKDELKLLGEWTSPFVSRAKLALSLKGLSHDYLEEDLSNKSELLLSSNPVHKKVPVLIHNGKSVCESMVIVQYIDEAFVGSGPSLLPVDPHERAVARFWAAYVDDKLVAPFVQSLEVKTEKEKAEAMKQVADAVETLEGALRECFKGEGFFFGGDGVGIVDVSLGGMLSWVSGVELMSGAKIIDPAKTPLLAAWRERFTNLEATKAVLPELERVIEYAMKMEAAQAAAAASDT